MSCRADKDHKISRRNGCLAGQLLHTADDSPTAPPTRPISTLFSAAILKFTQAPAWLAILREPKRTEPALSLVTIVRRLSRFAREKENQQKMTRLAQDGPRLALSRVQVLLCRQACLFVCSHWLVSILANSDIVLSLCDPGESAQVRARPASSLTNKRADYGGGCP